MTAKIYINLPTSDLAKAEAFYKALGFTKNDTFSDENASGMSWSNEIYLMILTNKFFLSFIPHKTLSDANKTCEVQNSLQLDSKAAVDAFTEKAVAAGAVEYRPADDLGFMYGRNFEDLDGHVRSFFWMDPTQMPKE